MRYQKRERAKISWAVLTRWTIILVIIEDDRMPNSDDLTYEYISPARFK